MSRHRRRFYLNKEKAKLAGVCAGLADYLGWDVTFIRIAWIFTAIVWPPAAIPGYILLAWLIEPKPGNEISHASLEINTPIPSYRRLGDAKARFERLETRLRNIESVVTSREFQMDRELKGTGGAG